MDRQTLSQYGWIVVVVLVLAILLGMATPFGQTVGAAVTDTVAVMEEKNNSVLDDAFSGEEDGTDEVKMLDGDGQVYNKALSGSTLTFRSSAPLNTFESVEINGEVVDPSNYTVTEGSTIVTFKESYAKFLDEGDHEIAIVSKNGTADADFAVSYIAGLYDNDNNLIKTWDELVAENPGCIDNYQSPDLLTLTQRWINTKTNEIITHREFAENMPDNYEDYVPYGAFGPISGKLVVDESVKQIGAYAFNGCSLSEIAFKGGNFVDGWDEGLTSLEKLYFTPSLDHFNGFNSFGNGCSMNDVTMYFVGTTEECETIMEANGSWGGHSINYTVYCLDGVLKNF